ncbi:hypothetical protein PRZ48_012190 [Zasmidium cellare]|uniref:F-box domain-containing protein n=1 Tax=Zasmidium cellare TaxID=395010 RepID=A0ABR0E4M8_ZASCE|nr:hypothetical protein PRZ48_012190 [Zasmidium cellare]
MGSTNHRKRLAFDKVRKLVARLASKFKDSKPCLFLDKLPAEIRNEIYALAFTPDFKDESETVDLYHTDPPSPALITTCKTISNEAKRFYKHAYRKYWRESNFQLDTTSAREKIMAGDLSYFFIPAIRLYLINLDQISKLVILDNQPDYKLSATLLDSRGGWKGVLKRPGREDRVDFLWVKKHGKGVVELEEVFNSEKELKEALAKDPVATSVRDQLRWFHRTLVRWWVRTSSD